MTETNAIQGATPHIHEVLSSELMHVDTQLDFLPPFKNKLWELIHDYVFTAIM